MKLSFLAKKSFTFVIRRVPSVHALHDITFLLLDFIRQIIIRLAAWQNLKFYRNIKKGILTLGGLL